MTAFVLLALALGAAAIAAVAIPLLRPGGERGAPAWWAAGAAAAVIVVGAPLLYTSFSDWSWRAPEASDSPRTMVANLARRLERDPDNLEGWLMLGRAYTVLEQYPLAARAYGRADRLAGGRNAEALMGQAEALTLMDENELDGRAGQLIEQALKQDPTSGKALFFGAAAALRRNDLPLARERFAALLALNPPANVRPILEEQIAAIDERLAAQGGTASAAQPAPDAESPASNAASVRVTVRLDPALGAAVPPSMPLFVIVRDPERPGPPLAVKKLASQFPQTVELTPADAMIAGRTFGSGQRLEVVARIARSGSALGGRGDPFGQVAYEVGKDALVEVVIDRLQP